jgi:hypothetical protein
MQEHKELINEYLCDRRSVVIIAPKEEGRETGQPLTRIVRQTAEMK